VVVSRAVGAAGRAHKVWFCAVAGMPGGWARAGLAVGRFVLPGPLA